MRDSQSLVHSPATRHVERFYLTGILESMGYAAKNLGPVGTLDWGDGQAYGCTSTVPFSVLD